MGLKVQIVRMGWQLAMLGLLCPTKLCSRANGSRGGFWVADDNRYSLARHREGPKAPSSYDSIIGKRPDAVRVPKVTNLLQRLMGRDRTETVSSWPDMAD